MRTIRYMLLGLALGLLVWMWLNPRRQQPHLSSAPHAGSVRTPPSSRGDDLTVIQGIGPAYARALNAAGIFTFDQLGRQDPDGLAAVLKDARLTAARIRRDRWIEQARER